jgi:hypothetical protein
MFRKRAVRPTTMRIAAVAVAAAAVAIGAGPAFARTAMVPTGGVTGTRPVVVTSAHGTASTQDLTQDLAAARLATAKYATNLSRAKADGYGIITMMMPNMGFHFMNPKIAGFDVRKPQILVYEHHGSTWQLGALEWVFTKMPKNPPLPNATFGSFPAACHYKDGNFIPDENSKTCPKKDPQTGSPFNFWHPDLITMHVWAWYPNPAGLYSSTNPLVAPFNKG